ncbi:MAG: polyprenyl synthetase family protein, partial [Clostridia bacterium]|nr:polyprenyl synthetase family protein [Clostridia bacterium]
TYSLIHDDLPCMDNDDVRRGKRSCHMQYGEATAVLAGDGLLNLATEVAFSGPLSNKNYAQACQYMFKMSGIAGMVHGQSLDLFTETKTLADAEAVALHKTGDLIRAAIVCGALCGGAKAEEIDTFDNFASKLGICYQVVDDLLDAEKCEKSFLDVFSERTLKEYASKLTAEILSLCDSLPYDLTFVKEIASNNLSRKF